jgi:hypothetical protein
LLLLLLSGKIECQAEFFSLPQRKFLLVIGTWPD